MHSYHPPIDQHKAITEDAFPAFDVAPHGPRPAPCDDRPNPPHVPARALPSIVDEAPTPYVPTLSDWDEYRAYLDFHSWIEAIREGEAYDSGLSVG